MVSWSSGYVAAYDSRLESKGAVIAVVTRCGAQPKRDPEGGGWAGYGDEAAAKENNGELGFGIFICSAGRLGCINAGEEGLSSVEGSIDSEHAEGFPVYENTSSTNQGLH
ncbi:Hypothetical predicted protein [Prunus dulcis]|uniref:Uncharacterized protein n=1 Tax=Prunus dulcis TaxID=3755 RepID=A0A5E4F0J9_PRUDU|nr:Hypothetical predicted protein [Prunus dulcis]